MPRVRKVHHENLIGLHCPKCAEPLHGGMVAKSYPVAGGQFRRRYCGCGTGRGCGETVTSFETVMGAQVELLVVNGLSGPQLAALRQVAKAFGAKVASR